MRFGLPVGSLQFGQRLLHRRLRAAHVIGPRRNQHIDDALNVVMVGFGGMLLAGYRRDVAQQQCVGSRMVAVAASHRDVAQRFERIDSCSSEYCAVRK